MGKGNDRNESSMAQGIPTSRIEILPCFTVPKPASCEECDFFSNGADEGSMCCGVGSNLLTDGIVTSPEEAATHGFLQCKFVYLK